MKYLNAAEVLPEELIREIQKHVSGNLIYVPNAVTPKKWAKKADPANITANAIRRFAISITKASP